MINVLTRSRDIPGSGDSAIQQLLEQQADESCDDATRFDIEYERQIFHWAADRVREQVDSETWSAFWMTAVDGESADTVGRILGKSSGGCELLVVEYLDESSVKSNNSKSTTKKVEHSRLVQIFGLHLRRLCRF